MLSSRLAFIAVGVACVAAAGAGSYLATRENLSSSASAQTAAQPPTTATADAIKADTSPAAASTKPARAAETDRRAPGVVQRPSQAAPQVAQTSTPATPPAFEPAPAPPAPEPPAPAPVEPAAVVRDDPRGLDLPDSPAPPRRAEELMVSKDSVIGLQLETSVSSDRAHVEDRVDARVVRNVTVGGQVAIPSGTRVIGSVMLVEGGGKLKERARLGIRFHTLVLADGTRLPITTETLYRTGDAPKGAAKIGGGAAAGAILGAIIGGGKGAAIGGTLGAGAGTAAAMAGDANAATFPSGTDVTARILAPVTIIVEK